MNISKFALLAIITFAFAGVACVEQEQTIAHEMTGVDAGMTEDSDPLVQRAQEVIAKSPDSPKGYNQLAVVYIRKARETGDFPLNIKADELIDKALALAPQDLTARKLKASLHLTLHRFPEGLEMGKQLQKEVPEDSFIWGVITDANTELGNYEEAVAAAQRMVDIKPNTSSYARVAYLRSLHGDHLGAVEMYKVAARTADPGDKEVQSWCLTQLGDEFLRNGKVSDAEKVYDEALSILPQYPLALVGKGRARAAQNDFSGASDYIARANERTPHTHTVILLGDVYKRMGDLAKSRAQYDLAENGEEKLGDLHDAHRVALFWADNDINLDAALKIAQDDYETQKDIYAADTLAWCLYKKGRLDEAKSLAREAMRLGTNDAMLRFHAGMIEKGLGNRAEAKRLLESALALNPTFDLFQAERARKALEELN
ncbi:MAG: tetratricopeptide repeat protein [Blastocatellia bacterium]|nr:tetratricopeptide repeat protein [Blastocatellia bacterium]